MKSAARLVLIASLMVSIGGHWGVLQTLAWARMISEYTADKGLVEGIVQTFNGARPCALCKKISSAQGQEKKKSPAPLEKSAASSKWLGAADSRVTVIPAPQKYMPVNIPGTSCHLLHAQWQSTPPSPPPRCGAA